MCAISLGRRVQEPLYEFTSLLSSHDEEYLSLILHPLQVGGRREGGREGEEGGRERRGREGGREGEGEGGRERLFIVFSFPAIFIS